jgi:hypothetical protein
MKRKMVALLTGAMLMLAAGSASALTLTIDDGTANAVYTSGVSGANSSTGTGVSAISFDGGLFTLTNVAATTKYTGAKSFVDSASVDLTYNGSGAKTITITASDINFLLNTLASNPNTLATMSMHVISTDAPVTFSGYFDNANVLNSTANLINTLNIPAGGTTAGPVTDAIFTSNPFSLTDVITIAFTGAGETVSLDANLTVVPTPEPGTMVLLGIGMLGLAVYGKRRMNKEA